MVDLSELGFADISLMVDLVLLARRLRAGGRSVMLRGAQPQIRALIESFGIHRLAGIELDGPTPAVA